MTELDFDDRRRPVYRALSQAGPGNDINAGSPGSQKAPTWGLPAWSLFGLWPAGARRWRPAVVDMRDTAIIRYGNFAVESAMFAILASRPAAWGRLLAAALGTSLALDSP
jgi:hypothetical protein